MIDIELQKKLRKEYNPEGSELRNMQLKLLDILKCIDKICQKHNISYWLASGTLLGAARHNGFIPWDDDLDIEILHTDKKKFIEACIQDLPPHYVIQCHQTDPYYYKGLIKIRDVNSKINEIKKIGNREFPVSYKYNGFFIDVFTEEPSYKLFLWLSKIPIRIISIAQYKWKLGTKYLDILFQINEAIFMFFRFISKLNPLICHYYHSYGCWFISSRKKKDLLPTKKIMFEGEYFNAPNNVDSYLRHMYGNYMELPDTIVRKPMHNISL